MTNLVGNMKHKIICHAPGDECLGCSHYYGNADRCKYLEPEKPVDDLLVIQAMREMGGSFVKALAECCRHADDDNLKKIKHAFKSIWERYSHYAKQRNKNTA